MSSLIAAWARAGSAATQAASRVLDRQQMLGTLLRRKPDELVQRIAGAAAPARRRAGERQSLDLLRMAQREFLRHHAAERYAEHARRGPTDGVHYLRRVVGVVGHAVGAVGLARLAESALVIGEEGEATGQRAFQHAGLAPEIAVGAGDDQEARALAVLLVEKPDIAPLDKGHAPPLLFGPEPVLVSALASVNCGLPRRPAHGSLACRPSPRYRKPPRNGWAPRRWRRACPT
jgi:hypothetical protein